MPYPFAICSGYKTIETRGKNMLSALVGKRVAVVRTKKGYQPVVIGYVDIIGAEFCKAEDFDKYYEKHLVQPGSKYAPNGKGKWFYHLANASFCARYPLPAYAVRHGRSWCEF